MILIPVHVKMSKKQAAIYREIMKRKDQVNLVIRAAGTGEDTLRMDWRGRRGAAAGTLCLPHGVGAPPPRPELAASPMPHAPARDHGATRPGHVRVLRSDAARSRPRLAAQASRRGVATGWTAEDVTLEASIIPPRFGQRPARRGGRRVEPGWGGGGAVQGSE